MTKLIRYNDGTYNEGALPLLGFSRFFDSLWRDASEGRNDFSFSKGMCCTPPVNVQETDKGFEINFSAPGCKKDAFSIELTGSVLRVACTCKAETEEEDENYLRKEFSCGSFAQSIQLPDMRYDTSKVTANYQEGVLNIYVPKPEEQVTSTTKIKVS